MRHIVPLLLLPVLLFALWTVACTDDYRDVLPYRTEDLGGVPVPPDLTPRDLQRPPDLAQPPDGPPGDGPTDARPADGGG